MDGLENNESLEQGLPESGPTDLAQAFKMYNSMDQEPAENAVEPGEPEGEPAAGEEPDDGAGVGGSADVVEPIDYNPARESILKDVQQRALQNVRKSFSDEGIEMWEIGDLYEKDENTGRVRFRNPDDPQHDFANRYEAMQFIELMNKQINQKFRADVNTEQRRLIQEEAPKLRLIEFAPKYDAMDQMTKDIFEDMIEPYAIRGSNGDIIGFNVNLDAVHAQAGKIAKRLKESYAPQQKQQQPDEPQKKAPKGPALDAKTSASQSDDWEPKTIGEALKAYDAQQRKAKK